MVILKKYLNIYIFLFFAFTITFLWYLIPQQFISSDPWSYSERAHQIASNLDFGSGYFDFRLGVVIPVAILYNLFGVNIITTNMWMLISVIIILFTIWISLPSNKIKIVGLSLAITSPIIFGFTRMLFPDIVAAAFMSISSFILFKRKNLIAEKYSISFPLFAVLFLFIAFLAKLSAYWVLPLWIYHLIKDIMIKDYKSIKNFFLPSAIFGLILGTLYLYFSYVVWGDMLARFKSINSLAGVHLWTSSNISNFDLIKRLTISPIIFFIKQLHFIPFFFCMALWIKDSFVKDWIYYTLTCTAFFWLGSTSFTQYEPMPLSPRMILPILPGIFIVSAYVISSVNISGQLKVFSNILPLIIVLSMNGYPFYKYINTINSESNAENLSMIQLKKIIKNKDKEFLLLCSDQRSPKYLKTYFSFKYPKNLKVLFFKELEKFNVDDFNKKNILVHVDKKRSEFLKNIYDIKNYDSPIEKMNLSTLFQLDHISIYESKNNFENQNILQIHK